MTFDSAPHPWWHVIWVTHLAWPPKDERGDWTKLGALYAELRLAGAEVEMSEPLPSQWQCQSLLEGTVTLPKNSWTFLTEDLKQLAAEDRVAGDTPIHSIAVDATSVQMLLSCPADKISQRVGRMKSRSSTLLDFRPQLGIGGAGTWSRGIWRARLACAKAFGRVEEFIANHAKPRPN